MLGRKARSQLEFVVAGSLRDLIPDDHILVRVGRVLDLGWLRAEIAGATPPRRGVPASIRRPRCG
jgi:hypothetical protein